MDLAALLLSTKLGGATVALLLPLALAAGRALAVRDFRGKGAVEALLALPLLLPPTVIGFYLLVAFGRGTAAGDAFEALVGTTLAFSFAGLLLASILVNVPFAVQPIQRAFEAVPAELREAAACCGMGRWTTFLRVELPLAWPGIVSAVALVFAHTLGEFGVVLMVGGAIPGETRTASIAIYDRVQAFDDRGAAIMSATLLALSLAALAVVHGLAARRRGGRRR
ncbi:MAG: molybdate ABC transporter permease subunit [Alphaproteobacteria bacterium]|nr:molybdate ABC transporter permease subunit [Alphaproteobacteria bacterium]